MYLTNCGEGPSGVNNDADKENDAGAVSGPPAKSELQLLTPVCG